MFLFTSLSTEATLRCAAPFIPPTSSAHLFVEKVLCYAGLRRHLSMGLTETNQDEEQSEGCATDDEIPVSGVLVSNLIKSMRSATKRTANKCAVEASRIEEALNNGEVEPATMEAIMVALGFSQERSGGANLSDSNKEKK